MKVVEREIGLVKPYEKNPRIIPEEAVERVAASIREFGFQQPIVVDKDGVIIVGHTRLKAAEKLGLEKVPVVVADLSPEKARAYRLADNKTNEATSWDDDLLFSELTDIEADIADLDFSMLDFGFSALDLGSGDSDIGEPFEDDFDGEVPDETDIKEGDMFQLGWHVLMCGDSTSKSDVKKLMGGGTVKADMVLTDPPYGINIVNVDRIEGDNKIHFGKIGSSKIAKTTPYRPVANDDSIDTAKESFELMREFSKSQIIFGGNYFTDFLPSKPCWCVWDKQNDGNNFADVELAWTSFDKAARIFRWKWNGMVRQGSHEIEGAKRVHPTQKPVGLFGNILSDFTKEGDIILDLFGGSGTTLIACEQLGRKCRMMELDPHYCQVIIDRWEALTGEKAEKIA